MCDSHVFFFFLQVLGFSVFRHQSLRPACETREPICRILTKMPSRTFPPSPSTSQKPDFFSKTKLLFFVITISASIVVFLSFLYLLYHLWNSLVRRSKTIPFDSSAPLKLPRFSYKELKKATNDFDSANIIGKGGSATVYRGILRDGKLIAIKRLDSLSLQTEREFQNELQILGGLRSPFLVALLGYCVEKSKRVLVYEYMPNRSLQESLFSDKYSSLCWERRFEIILDVARALEFLHLDCDPPVIHGDVKPSNVLLDSEFRAKISDFGLSRSKMDGEFVVDMFSQDLGRSEELSGMLAAETPSIGTPLDHNSEVDFSVALQASSSTKNGRSLNNVKALKSRSFSHNPNLVNQNEIRINDGSNGKEVAALEETELSSIEHSKELNSNTNLGVDDRGDMKQWGKDWWWRQDGSGELCSKDYVTEWIGSQIYPAPNPDWDEETKGVSERIDCDYSTQIEKLDSLNEYKLQSLGRGLPRKSFEDQELKSKKNRKKKHKKMQEWWKEEHFAEISKKGNELKHPITKLKKQSKTTHFHLHKQLYFYKRKMSGEQGKKESNPNGEFSFRKGWKKKSTRSTGSDKCSGDLFSRELSSTTSMRGTLCYVAPEYGGSGFFMEKADIYSLGVLILVIISGRRPLHVLASPMKLEKANLISWCRQLAQSGNILELVDEKLKDEYNKEQASLCINLALTCLQKMPELRPEIGEIVKILTGEIDLPPLPFEFSPSPPSKLYSRSRRKQKASTAQ